MIWDLRKGSVMAPISSVLDRRLLCGKQAKPFFKENTLPWKRVIWRKPSCTHNYRYFLSTIIYGYFNITTQYIFTYFYHWLLKLLSVYSGWWMVRIFFFKFSNNIKDCWQILFQGDMISIVVQKNIAIFTNFERQGHCTSTRLDFDSKLF
jgi:hypothetical protein